MFSLARHVLCDNILSLYHIMFDGMLHFIVIVLLYMCITTTIMKIFMFVLITFAFYVLFFVRLTLLQCCHDENLFAIFIQFSSKLFIFCIKQ